MLKLCPKITWGFCKTVNILQIDVGANLSMYANPMYTSTLGIFGKQPIGALLVQVVQE